MFLTNKQKAKKFDKYERQKKDIIKCRAEIDAIISNMDKISALLKQKQNELKDGLEELLNQKGPR